MLDLDEICRQHEAKIVEPEPLAEPLTHPDILAEEAKETLQRCRNEPQAKIIPVDMADPQHI